jgi:hypothetical protein
MPQALVSFVGSNGQQASYSEQQQQQQSFTPQPTFQQPQQQQHQEQQQQQQQQQQQYQNVQIQLAMDMLARANGQQPAPVGGDMNLRGAATGESYASSSARREDWNADNDVSGALIKGDNDNTDVSFVAHSSYSARSCRQL